MKLESARLLGPRDGEYRYARPTDDEDAPARPAQYPVSLDSVLGAALRQCRTRDQAVAVVESKAIQIEQTGYVGRGRLASEEEKEWAIDISAASRAAAELARVPGTCQGCNSAPCRCWA